MISQEMDRTSDADQYTDSLIHIYDLSRKSGIDMKRGIIISVLTHLPLQRGGRTDNRMKSPRKETGTFPPPMAHCNICNEYIRLDHSHSSCARTHNCYNPPEECPLAQYFVNQGPEEQGVKD